MLPFPGSSAVTLSVRCCAAVAMYVVVEQPRRRDGGTRDRSRKPIPVTARAGSRSGAGSVWWPVSCPFLSQPWTNSSTAPVCSPALLAAEAVRLQSHRFLAPLRSCHPLRVRGCLHALAAAIRFRSSKKLPVGAVSAAVCLLSLVPTRWYRHLTSSTPGWLVGWFRGQAADTPRQAGTHRNSPCPC